MSDLLATDLLPPGALAALLQVVLIDLMLAGDNAIVIGLAAGGLPAQQRHRAILIGIVAATVLRLAFAAVAVQLLRIVGLLLAGGIVLMWVTWKMWRELRAASHTQESGPAGDAPVGTSPRASTRKTLAVAVRQIVVADVSMSLDNVLAIGGAARDHPIVLVFGLALSVALMGLAADLLARLLQRHRWIGYVGIAVVLYVALDMIYRGALEVWAAS